MNPSAKATLLELEVKRVDLLFRQNIAGMLAIFVNTIAFASYTWGSIPSGFLIPWILILNISTAVRFIAYHRWQRARPLIRHISELKFWQRGMYSTLLISGLGWGTLGWMSAFAEPGAQVLAGLIIASMSAGAMITYASSRPAMSCVVAPSLLLWATGLFWSRVGLNQLLGSMILFYCFLMLIMGRNLYSTILHSLILDVRLRKSEERLRMSMEASDSLIWDWDLADHDFYWEGNVLLFPEGPAQLKKILSPLIDDMSVLDSEHVVRDKAGAYHYVAIRGKLVKDTSGKPARFTGICWDITTKKNEEFLRQERDLHEAANKAKSVLLANASHELRTPLSAIIGFSEALLRNTGLNAQNRRDVQAIFRQGHYMVSLVNDLLDLSKIETNRLYIQKSAMSPSLEIEDAVSALRNAIDQKGLQVEIVYESQIPTDIQADSMRFRQVFMNVLNNAVKFSQKGNIRIAVSSSIETNNMAFLKIRVADEGMGIDTEIQHQIFQPFVRGESPEVQRVQGSGLGLALSASLMRMMGGELRLIKSAPHQGSIFEITFALGPADKLKFAPAPSLKSSSQKKLKISEDSDFLKGRRVLVVDDSVDLRLLMSRYLNRQGASVETSENGKEAVETALRDPFDIILMDIKMPVMDGYEATALLREKGYTKPIVALTAQASVDGQQKSYEMGFDGYLSKPVDVGLLKEFLKV